MATTFKCSLDGIRKILGHLGQDYFHDFGATRAERHYAFKEAIFHQRGAAGASGGAAAAAAGAAKSGGAAASASAAAAAGAAKSGDVDDDDYTILEIEIAKLKDEYKGEYKLPIADIFKRGDGAEARAEEEAESGEGALIPTTAPPGALGRRQHSALFPAPAEPLLQSYDAMQSSAGGAGAGSDLGPPMTTAERRGARWLAERWERALKGKEKEARKRQKTADRDDALGAAAAARLAQAQACLLYTSDAADDLL